MFVCLRNVFLCPGERARRSANLTAGNQMHFCPYNALGFAFGRGGLAARHGRCDRAVVLSEYLVEVEVHREILIINTSAVERESLNDAFTAGKLGGDGASLQKGNKVVLDTCRR